MRRLWIALSILALVATSKSWGERIPVAHPLPASVQSIWFTPDQSVAKEALLFLPRLIYRPVRAIVAGKTAQRAKKTVTSLAFGAKALALHHPDDIKRCDFESSDSLLNVGGTINSLVSDIAAVVKSPFFAEAKLVRRVQVCTTNLTNSEDPWEPSHGQMYDPADHVGILIDNGMDELSVNGELNDLLPPRDKGAVTCRAAPLVQRESESIAIEKLECLNSNYKIDYRFFTNNCGGYTSDVLKMAGFGLPDLPNLGVGTYIRTQRKAIREKRAEAKAFCDQAASDFLSTIRAVETGGQLPDLSALRNIVESSTYSNDARLQWAVTAARSSDAEVRHVIAAVLAGKNFPELNAARGGPFGIHLAKHLRAFYSGLTKSQLQWMDENFSWSASLRKKIFARTAG